jgi:hypothetical protein
MSGKKLFLVVGPESSGTRITSRLLIDSGCWGSYDHYQLLDSAVISENVDEIKQLTEGFSHVVFRQSIPHGPIWPDLVKLQSLFQAAGFSVFFIFTIRDWVINETDARQHHAYPKKAQMMTRWKHIFKFLPEISNFCFFITSLLFTKPKEAIESLTFLINYKVKPDLVNLISSTSESFKNR